MQNQNSPLNDIYNLYNIRQVYSQQDKTVIVSKLDALISIILDQLINVIDEKVQTITSKDEDETGGTREILQA